GGTMSYGSSGTAPETGTPDAESSGATLHAALLDSLTFGVILEDADGNVGYVNQTLCHFFGFESPDKLSGLPMQEATGRLLASVIEPADAACDLATLSGQVWRLHSGRTVQITCSPLAPQPPGVVWQFCEVIAPQLPVAVSHPDTPSVVNNTPVV